MLNEVMLRALKERYSSNVVAVEGLEETEKDKIDSILNLIRRLQPVVLKDSNQQSNNEPKENVLPSEINENNRQQIEKILNHYIHFSSKFTDPTSFAKHLDQLGEICLFLYQTGYFLGADATNNLRIVANVTQLSGSITDFEMLSALCPALRVCSELLANTPEVTNDVAAKAACYSLVLRFAPFASSVNTSLLKLKTAKDAGTPITLEKIKQAIIYHKAQANIGPEVTAVTAAAGGACLEAPISWVSWGVHSAVFATIVPIFLALNLGMFWCARDSVQDKSGKLREADQLGSELDVPSIANRSANSFWRTVCCISEESAVGETQSLVQSGKADELLFSDPRESGELCVPSRMQRMAM